jgi:DNA-binding transcriptional MerR regulator
MTYSTKQLADLAGVTPRTLRYYDKIGLLKTQRDPDNQYRVYTQAEVDRLQPSASYNYLRCRLPK